MVGEKSIQKPRLEAAGVPVFTNCTFTISPALMLWPVEESVQLVAAPLIVQLAPVTEPLTTSSAVQLPLPPGAVST